MSCVFFISDLHLGHEKTCTVFKKTDGTPLRPFESASDMDEAIIKRWNNTVRGHDKVYVLGDVVIRKEFLPTVSRLNGKLRLVRGNHDIFPTDKYLEYFDEVYGVRVLEGLILSHIPIHPDCIERYGTNVHGHLHANVLTDVRYLNVSVEQTNYTPLSLEQVRERIKKNVEMGSPINYAYENRS